MKELRSSKGSFSNDECKKNWSVEEIQRGEVPVERGRAAEERNRSQKMSLKGLTLPTKSFRRETIFWAANKKSKDEKKPRMLESNNQCQHAVRLKNIQLQHQIILQTNNTKKKNGKPHKKIKHPEKESFTVESNKSHSSHIRRTYKVPRLKKKHTQRKTVSLGGFAVQTTLIWQGETAAKGR